MKEYILNDTPVRTSINYGINNIKLDLEIPEITEYENVKIEYPNEKAKKSLGENWDLDGLAFDDEAGKTLIESDIGLSLECNHIEHFNIKANEIIDEPIVITYDLNKEQNVLTDYFEINAEENSKSNFIIVYKNSDNSKTFHYAKHVVIAEDYAEVNVKVINLLNDESDSFIAFENEGFDNSKINHTIVDFGGKNKISNYYSDMSGYSSENNLKNIYFGTNKDIIDINYNINMIGENAKCNIESQGAISGESKKNFKGTIDFKEGSTKSKGIENENCILLSESAKSKSLPMLLCHEEDVQGEHGVSTGKPNAQKIFYMMSKGLSYKEAIELIVKANFDAILDGIDNENIRDEIEKDLDSKLK